MPNPSSPCEINDHRQDGQRGQPQGPNDLQLPAGILVRQRGNDGTGAMPTLAWACETPNPTTCPRKRGHRHPSVLASRTNGSRQFNHRRWYKTHSAAPMRGPPRRNFPHDAVPPAQDKRRQSTTAPAATPRSASSATAAVARPRQEPDPKTCRLRPPAAASGVSANRQRPPAGQANRRRARWDGRTLS